MKITIPIIILLLAIGGAAYAGGLEVKKKAGEYDLEIKIDRNPPIIGDNRIEIEIRSGGKPVTDAKVLVNYYMPPMPRMAPMNYTTDAKLKKETYRATMNLIMAGPWYISIIIDRGGKIAKARVNVDAI